MTSKYINNGLSLDQKTHRDGLFMDNYNKEQDFSLKLKDRTYNLQYFSMYQYRLLVLKDRVDQNAIWKWGDGDKRVDGQIIKRKEKILDIESGEMCWVSGTIFLDMNNKQNILKDVENGVDDVLPKAKQSYVSGDVPPVLMLEDDSGRAILHNDDFLKKNLLVTGCFVAVLGIEVQAGIFEILDVVYPVISPQLPLPTKRQPSGEYIALVSGLSVSDAANYDLKLELLKQYILGELGNESDTSRALTIKHLVIAGSSVASLPEKTGEDDFTSASDFGSKNVSRFNAESIEMFDSFLADIVSSVPVSVMPGEDDPTEICLPQQPLHRSIFPSTKRYANGPNLQYRTNPTWLEVNGIRILGTAGENVNDICKYLPESLTTPESTIDIMRANIKWQNFTPTAPDTLYCYPFKDSDPFTLSDETPHLYFVGNQEKFESAEFRAQRDHNSDDEVTVQLVSIPKFATTGQVVLVDTGDLSTNVVRIDVDDGELL